MADLLIAILCVAVALAGLLSLVDSWLAGRHDLARLMAERALARDGFEPPLERSDLAQRRMRAVARAPRSTRPVPIPAGRQASWQALPSPLALGAA